MVLGVVEMRLQMVLSEVLDVSEWGTASWGLRLHPLCFIINQTSNDENDAYAVVYLVLGSSRGV